MRVFFQVILFAYEIQKKERKKEGRNPHYFIYLKVILNILYRRIECIVRSILKGAI